MSTKSISIKKSQVRDKYGIYIPPTSQDSKVGTSLKAENHALLDRISHLEKYAMSLQSELEEAVGDSEASHKTIEKLESCCCCIF